MSNVGAYLWLIPALPLLGSAAIAVLGRRVLREQSHWPCVLGAGGACLFALAVLVAVANDPVGPFRGADLAPETDLPPHLHTYCTWFQAGNVDVGLSLRADALTAIMLVMITFIGTLIAIFSIGYMHHDPGYPRFFAEFSLFVFFMTGLVLADNFIVLYGCWEGVGVCSYLLIGFWFQRPSAAAAARKAFLVTRLGDIGLFLGILTLWAYQPAPGYSLRYEQILGPAALAHYQAEGVLLPACLLIFVGCMGKSAQFPLHVWLPDAMEGPTPVSALIHAATMVTAGVYLVARCMPLFGLEPVALLVVGCIGGFTALLAAVIAVTQTDLKRVLAYSTLSQLGYMFLALGCGVSNDHRLAAFAVTAAIFHLFTHAFFKALLFLSAGSVMHAMGDVIDMRRFSGLRSVLPVTHWTFLCGAAALAGVPLLSGFWSKDEILTVSFLAQKSVYGGVYLALFYVALITAGITAFYTTRAYVMTFRGEVRIPPEAHGHAHESPPVMTVPLMVLAVGAVAVGGILGPTHLFGGFLEHHWMKLAFPAAIAPEDGATHFSGTVMLLSIASVAVGVGPAWWMYDREPSLADRAARSMAVLYELSRNKFYLDELYDALIVRPVTALAHVLRVVDQYVLDGLVDLIGQLPAAVGNLLRPAQNGLVQFYALLMMLGVAGFVVAVLLR
jgi:NADH-quinone oxidoreductase subunit L